VSSYVAEILSPGERLVYEGHLSWLAILPMLVGAVVLIVAGAVLTFSTVPVGIALMVLGLIWIGVALIRRNSTELAVTDRRVIAKFGFISRSTVELNLTKLESVRVEQSVMGRICNYGSVYVTGTGSTMDPIPFISDPIKFRQAVQSATDALQRPEARVS